MELGSLSAFTSVIAHLWSTKPGWVLIAGVAVLLLAGAAVTVVPHDQRLVVWRLGRLTRVAGPGLVLRLPGWERGVPLSLRPVDQRVEVTATTLEGVVVHLIGHCRWRVDGIAAAAAMSDRLSGATADLVEQRLGQYVGSLTVESLLESRATLEAAVRADLASQTAVWGVQVDLVELDVVDAELSGQLVHSLRRPALGDGRSVRARASR